MKKLILILILIPYLLLCQSFNITDINGNNWDSDLLLLEGKTIVIQFFSPSLSCWPSYQSIMNLTETYYEYSTCNDVFFIQIAQWGEETQVSNFINLYGDSNIPTVLGGDEGEDIIMEWVNLYGLMWAYECWVLSPSNSIVQNLPWMSDLSQDALMDHLEDDGFSACEISAEDVPYGVLNIGEYENENPDKTIYDLQGKPLNLNSHHGYYIKDKRLHFKLK